MPIAHSYLFQRSFEFIPRALIDTIPPLLRGIYVLYQKNPNDDKKVTSKSDMHVVYIGMAHGDKAGIKGRLLRHNKEKLGWSHCSVFQVWDNIFPQQVAELEGLFRHLYRLDPVANKMNKQKAFKPLDQLTKQSKQDLKPSKPQGV